MAKKSDLKKVLNETKWNITLISIAGVERVRLPDGNTVAFRDYDHAIEIVKKAEAILEGDNDAYIKQQAVSLEGLSMEERDAIVREMMNK